MGEPILTLGEALRLQRDRHRLSNGEAARQYGLSEDQFDRWLADRMARLEARQALAFAARLQELGMGDIETVIAAHERGQAQPRTRRLKQLATEMR